MNMDALLRIKATVQGENNIRALGNSMQGVTGKVKNLQMAVGGLVGGFGALSGTLTAIAAGGALKGIMDTFGQYQADILALTRGLKNLGGTAPGSLEPLKRLASDLGEQTLFNEEDFNKGFALLTSFGNIGVEQYERVAKAASDVAQISGTDVRAAMMQLAKALNAPSQGVAALARSGIQFTEAQKDVIKELEATGKVAQAQELIFKELERQYGGASVAAAQGFAGSLDTMGEKIYDVQKALGPLIEQSLTPLVAVLTETADVLANQLLPAVDSLPDPVKTFAGALAGLTVSFIALKAAISGVLAITSTAAFASLLAAGPWIALAAGITAAAVALGSYQTEAQKAAAAVGGGTPADAARARNLAVQTQQEISLLEQQREAATGRERASIDRLLARRRKDLAELQAATAAAGRGAELPAGVTVPDLTAGGAADKAKAKKGGKSDAERLAEELQRSLAAGRELGTQFQRQILLQVASSDIERERLQIGFEYEDRQKQIAALKDEEQRINLTALNDEIRRLDLIALQTELVKQQTEEAQKLAKAFLDAASFGVQPSFAVDLGLAIEEARANLQELVSPLNVIRGAAESMGRAFGDAFRGLVSGSMTAKEALASFFQATADAFLDMAAQIITQLITITILESLSSIFGAAGGLSGAGALGPSGAVDISGSRVSGAALGLGSIGTPGSAAGFSGFGVGFRAYGGSVMGNMPYIVGEQGPELFVPAGSGNVLSNAATRAALAQQTAVRGAGDTRTALAQQTAVRGANAAGTAQQQPIDVRFESQVINGVEYVTAEQHQRGMVQAAERGRALALSALQNSVKTRKRVGMA